MGSLSRSSSKRKIWNLSRSLHDPTFGRDDGPRIPYAAGADGNVGAVVVGVVVGVLAEVRYAGRADGDGMVQHDAGGDHDAIVALGDETVALRA